MSNKVGPWTVLSRETVFENPWIRVEDHAVRHPNGAPGRYGVVRFKNVAVGVLPLTASGEVLLVGHPIDTYLFTLLHPRVLVSGVFGDTLWL